MLIGLVGRIGTDRFDFGMMKIITPGQPDKDWYRDPLVGTLEIVESARCSELHSLAELIFGNLRPPYPNAPLEDESCESRCWLSL
jgi:hypothetical protein